MPRPNFSTAATEAVLVGKFGLVGIINTLIDFTIYNVLHFKLGLALIQSNIISTTIAMVFSFVMNKRLVFKHHHGSSLKQAAIFLATTAFGLYVLQNGVIALLTQVWFEPLQLAVTIVHNLGLAHILSDRFVVNNGAKAIGTVLSLIWNYIMYKKVVFR